MKLPSGIYVQHGKGGDTYKVKWRDASGGQHSRTFKKLSDAKKWNNKVRADHDKGLAGPAGLNLTFEQLAEQWVSTMTDHRETTAKRRDGVIKNHLLPAFEGLKLVHITPIAVDKAVRKWRDANLSAHSIRTHLQILGQIMSYAVRSGLITMNPVTGTERPKLPQKEILTLNGDEFKRLHEAINPHYRTYLCVAVASGLRYSELVNLKVKDFDGSSLRVRSGKTSNAARVVPIAAPLAKQIQCLIADGEDPERPLFLTPTGSEVEYQNFRRRVFKPALEAAGIERITFHDLRSTRATMLSHNGIDAKTTHTLMGHRSIETTLKYYVNDSKESALLAAEVGQRFIDPVSDNGNS